MIHRLSAFASALIGCCLMASGNQLFDVDIDAAEKNKPYKSDATNPIVTFECLYADFTNGTARIRVSVENVNKDGKALLFFPQASTYQTLKKNKPKIEFTKKYIGENRVAKSFDKKLTKFGFGNVMIVTENETDSIGTFTVPLGKTDTISIPFYIASYDHGKLTKAKEKNLPHPKDQIAYKISREEIYQFAITVDGWSEHDATYLAVKADVDKLIASLNGVTFCPNAKHTPPLSNQQQSYKKEITLLKSTIDSILTEHKSNPRWMSDTPPNKAYTKLSNRLDSIKLNSYNKDCGNHSSGKIIIPKLTPKDNTQELYHQISDTYTKLRADRITKNEAVKEAQRIKNNASRCKNGKFMSNINEYYNRIINY